MEPEAKRLVRRFLRTQVARDGGFKNRAGTSDLYYSVFGGACLQALVPGPLPRRAVSYLKPFGTGEGLSFVHLTCLARCLAAIPAAAQPGRMDAVLERIEMFRSADEGYDHRGKLSEVGTAYAAYLALLAYEAGQRAIPAGTGVLESLAGLRARDGAYVNDTQSGLGTTTATTAAVMVRAGLGDEVEPETVAWLRARETAGGGFLASRVSPAPDLLSTAVALFALHTLGEPLDAQRDRTTGFVEMLWADSGGFRGYAADPVADCEYTCYALLALGCIEP